MICAKIQRNLLACETPGQPSIEVLRHLAVCAGCRSVQRRLLKIEDQLPLLPVPPSPRRDIFLQQIQQGQTSMAPAVSTSDLWLSPRPPKERGLRKVAVAFALAAALAVFALGWWAWPHKSSTGTPRPDPFAMRQQQRDQRLAAAKTPAQRVAILDELAQGLHREALQLAGRQDDEQLRVVARFYCEVVKVNLVDHARQLSLSERDKVLGAVTAHLLEVDSQVQKLLATDPSASWAESMRAISVAASQTQKTLYQMMS